MVHKNGGRTSPAIKAGFHPSTLSATISKSDLPVSGGVYLLSLRIIPNRVGTYMPAELPGGSIIYRSVRMVTPVAAASSPILARDPLFSTFSRRHFQAVTADVRRCHSHERKNRAKNLALLRREKRHHSDAAYHKPVNSPSEFPGASAPCVEARKSTHTRTTDRTLIRADIPVEASRSDRYYPRRAPIYLAREPVDSEQRLRDTY